MDILYIDEGKEVELYGFGATSNLGGRDNPDSLRMTVMEVQDIR